MRSGKWCLAVGAAAVAFTLATPPTLNQPAASASTPAAILYITTVAGKGSANFCGDGGAATTACLQSPRGVAIGPSGNLFIADTANSRIRKVALDGVINTIAGNGNETLCGDGGPAAAACIQNPRGVFVDTAGNIYVADTGNERIRKITLDGTITTIAGGGTGAFCGDGGPATSACLYRPRGVALDVDGNIYIADTGNNRVRKVTTGGTITTIAGNGSATFCGDSGPATSACLNVPSGVAVDPAKNVYIADTANNRVRKVTPGGTITTIAGQGTEGFCGDDGPATDACLYNPSGIAIDSALNVYVADRSNNRVRKVNSSGIISTITGYGTAGFCGDFGDAKSACVRAPQGVAVDAAGYLFVADSANQRVRKIGRDPLPPTNLLISATSSGGFVKNRSIPLTWSASDPSGIADFEIAWSGYRWNGTEYTLRTWRSHVTRRNTVFEGSYGMSYCFRQ